MRAITLSSLPVFAILSNRTFKYLLVSLSYELFFLTSCFLVSFACFTMVDRRCKQALYIDRFGFDIMPCFRYTDSGVVYWMSYSSVKCAACIRLNVPCNGNVILLDFLNHIGDVFDCIKSEWLLNEAEEERLEAEFVKRKARRCRLER